MVTHGYPCCRSKGLWVTLVKVKIKEIKVKHLFSFEFNLKHITPVLSREIKGF